MRLPSCGGMGVGTGVNDWDLFYASLGLSGETVTRIYKTADETRTSDSNERLDSDLKKTLTVGKWFYETIFFIDSNNAAHLNIAINGNATFTGGRPNGVISGLGQIQLQPVTDLTPITYSGAQIRSYHVFGVLDVTVEGEVGVWWAQFTENVYATKLLAGSWIDFKEIV